MRTGAYFPIFFLDLVTHILLIIGGSPPTLFDSVCVTTPKENIHFFRRNRRYFHYKR